MQIAAFEDDSVDAEGERQGNEEKCCHGGKTEEHSKEEGKRTPEELKLLTWA
jgi:hypothetical protein